jgi:hypothetical protein
MIKNYKKIILFSFIALLICTLVFFVYDRGDRNENSSVKDEKNIIHKGHRWDIVKVNDSIYVVIPSTHIRSEYDTRVIVFNINKVEGNIPNFSDIK